MQKHRGFVFVVLWGATPRVHNAAPISFVWTWALNLPHGFLWCKGDAKTIFPVVKVCFLKAKLSTSCASSAHLKTGNAFSRTTMKTVGRSCTRKIATIMNGIIGSVSLLWNFSTNLSQCIWKEWMPLLLLTLNTRVGGILKKLCWLSLYPAFKNTSVKSLNLKFT